MPDPLFSSPAGQSGKGRARRVTFSAAAREHIYRILETGAGYHIVATNGIHWITDGAGNFTASVPVRSVLQFLTDGRIVETVSRPVALDDA